MSGSAFTYRGSASAGFVGGELVVTIRCQATRQQFAELDERQREALTLLFGQSAMEATIVASAAPPLDLGGSSD